MINSCFVRKIDELGRIVIPVEVRQTLNIREKDPLEISLINNGIFMKKNIPACIFCNSTSELKDFFNKYICKDCIFKLKECDKNE